MGRRQVCVKAANTWAREQQVCEWRVGASTRPGNLQALSEKPSSAMS
ncbi:hypothetical protein E2C01_097641 [Portunus trituberculatus]|uniref:Uncharacterized protein n=1 Tax=Portunus trituberculatus TaxID=210409 RepID=A0A5B7K0X2_PORTR|nr:hypothetical protein [Portunus trituberculatus]